MIIRRSTNPAGRSSATGVGLIEILVAVVVLSFGMLGIAAMQIVSLRNSQSALSRSEAVVQTYAILDAMRANLDVARINGYDLSTLTCNVPKASTGTDAKALAANDLHDWITALHDNLGEQACGQVTCGSTKCEIVVTWDDSRATHAGDDSATGSLTTETLL
jgi:type IV pilus assembly protein PilV